MLYFRYFFTKKTSKILAIIEKFQKCCEKKLLLFDKLHDNNNDNNDDNNDNTNDNGDTTTVCILSLLQGVHKNKANYFLAWHHQTAAKRSKF